MGGKEGGRKEHTLRDIQRTPLVAVPIGEFPHCAVSFYEDLGAGVFLLA